MKIVDLLVIVNVLLLGFAVGLFSYGWTHPELTQMEVLQSIPSWSPASFVAIGAGGLATGVGLLIWRRGKRQGRREVDAMADLVQKCRVAVNDAIATTGLPGRPEFETGSCPGCGGQVNRAAGGWVCNGCHDGRFRSFFKELPGKRKR